MGITRPTNTPTKNRFIISSKASVCGDRQISVKEGDVGYFPKGVRHGFYNEAEGASMFIGIAARVEPLE